MNALRLALVLLLLTAAPAAAQTASVAGRAVAAEDSSAIPLSLVRLVPAAGGAGRTTLTDAAGSFRFDTVAAGSYRLRVERIGYTAAPTPPFAVRDGEEVRQTLRANLRAVVLAEISSGRPECYTADRLREVPALETLWREARKGIETRRAFRYQYAYRYAMSTRATARLRLLRDQRIARDTVIYTDPDTLRARNARVAREGYLKNSRGNFVITVPDDLELLSDEFLTTHCIEGNPARDEEGMWNLRFRPVRAPADRVDIAGTLRVDASTYVVRGLTFEYLRGRRTIGSGSVTYSEVATPAGRVRLPVLVRFTGDPGGTMGVVVTGFDGTVSYTGYRDFVKVGTE
jgi:hypothetical protein